MRLTKEELRELYQQRTARSAREREDCPGEATFVKATSGELNRPELESFVDHLITCSDCAEEYHLIQSLKPGMEQDTVRSGNSTAFVALWEKLLWKPAWRAAAAVTMIVIIVGVVTLSRLGQPGPELVPNERGDVALTMKIEPLNLAVLNEPPERLVWSESKSAESYQVVLYDFESTPIWESPLVKETSILIPSEVRSRLMHGRSVYWRVISHDGIERRQSEVFQFTVSP